MLARCLLLFQKRRKWRAEADDALCQWRPFVRTNGPDLTTDDFPHNQGHLIFKLLTFVIDMLPQGVTVATIQPKVIDYRRRTENYTKKKETHFVRALP